MREQIVRRVCWALAGVALAGSLTGVLAQQTTVHLYRYELAMRTGDAEYREEIRKGMPAAGPSYEIKRDQTGRMVSRTTFENGKAIGRWKYHYSDKQKFYDVRETWIDEQLTAIERVHRNAKGLMARSELYTAGGDLTVYTVREDLTDHIEAHSYTADGRPVAHMKTYYSASGVLIRRVLYISPESDEAGFTETEFDEQTGKTMDSRQIQEGKLANSKKYIYADGNLTHVDASDAQGKLFSVDAYDDGLLRKRSYGLAQGITREVRYSYDEKRWLVKSEIYSLGKAVCILTYDRDSDGTIQRSMAHSPDGTLWAEYPPPIVMDVGREGQAVGRSDALLHRTGSWW
jgi:antitoxin component YwqK of YwqJK toxin-antitoxin module